MRKKGKEHRLQLNFTQLWWVHFGMAFTQATLFPSCIGYSSFRLPISSLGKRKVRDPLCKNSSQNKPLSTTRFKIFYQLSTWHSWECPSILWSGQRSGCSSKTLNFGLLLRCIFLLGWSAGLAYWGKQRKGLLRRIKRNKRWRTRKKNDHILYPLQIFFKLSFLILILHLFLTSWQKEIIFLWGSFLSFVLSLKFIQFLSFLFDVFLDIFHDFILKCGCFFWQFWVGKQGNVFQIFRKMFNVV